MNGAGGLITDGYSNVTDVADWGDASVGHLVQHYLLVVITLVLRP